MFLKLPAVIAIELGIALLSFMLVGDKSRVGDVTFIFTFLTLFFALIYFGLKKLKIC